MVVVRESESQYMAERNLSRVGNDYEDLEISLDSTISFPYHDALSPHLGAFV